LENDVQLRTQKRVSTDVKARKSYGWLEESDTSSLQMKRHFVGLTAFTDETGVEDGVFTVDVGGGVSMVLSRGNKRYICTRDRLVIDDHITGEGWEHQTWERVGKWEVVAGSYYEQTLPEEGEAYDDIPEPEPEPEE
jgi:hypothetical protein